MDKVEVTPEELFAVLRDGQKQGFIAGVIVCLGVRYLHQRRRRYQEALAELRQARLR